MIEPTITYTSDLTEVITYIKFLMEEISNLKIIVSQMKGTIDQTRNTLRYVETAAYSGRERG